MLQIPGQSVYTEFTLKRLLKQLQQHFPQIKKLEIQTVYFVDSESHLAPESTNALRALLHDPAQTYLEPTGDAAFLILPRAGTISAWSSKATDIAKVCGLTDVKRLEKGRMVFLSLPEGELPLLDELEQIANRLHDRMTEQVSFDLTNLKPIFEQGAERALQTYQLDNGQSLADLNQTLGLALSAEEQEYLLAHYQNKSATDAELMMFAQANSEHCRHKIFNAQFTIDNQPKTQSLFDLIKATHKNYSAGVLSAYKDNAAVISGNYKNQWFWPDSKHGVYAYHQEPAHIMIKVETHNHPTAISPFPGAATGNGGEIRDEAATGRGAKTKAGLSGFAVSNLRIPGAIKPWEAHLGKPHHIASALQIMLEAPIGGAAFNNEFGRPNLAGFFRCLEIKTPTDAHTAYGYHKPIMIAGGYGNIRETQIKKNQIQAKNKIVVLGGPAMLIGLGGGAASSMAQGEGDSKLDFASVQRGNPEMQRRAQEVIDSCWRLGEENPIISIHDVGAGGLSNAIPELVHDAALGGAIDLAAIPRADFSLSPMELWSNESQERYVLAIAEKSLPEFLAFCHKERCPVAVVGEATSEEHLIVKNDADTDAAIDMPMSVLFANPPRLERVGKSTQCKPASPCLEGIALDEAIKRVLTHPSVASKKFLITIGDRSVGGLVARDQLVGPWQEAVADVAVTASGFKQMTGEAMAVGEKMPLAIYDAPASARMALAELITNIFAADIEKISEIKCSANWMAACGHDDQDVQLYHTVQALSEIAQELDICIPVGKDSLSMKTTWEHNNQQHTVYSPVSLVLSGFCAVNDIRKTLTPMLQAPIAASELLLVAVSSEQRLAGSILSQVFSLSGTTVPDVNARQLQRLVNTLLVLKKENLIQAYHDRSDGGLLVAALEMAFASRCGLNLRLHSAQGSLLQQLFNEEVGVVLQVSSQQKLRVQQILQEYNLAEHSHWFATCTTQHNILIHYDDEQVMREKRAQLQQLWADVSYQLQKMRDNPASAQQEHARLMNEKDPGLHFSLSFDADKFSAPMLNLNSIPKVAVLREQGVNGQLEMAAAFNEVGFECHDLHMQQLLTGEVKLADYQVLAACGGFSYGDVLGAGRGWAQSILMHADLLSQFAEFFARENTLTLGVCNGCQMLSQLTEIIPGSEHWPRFIANQSAQYEARLSMVEVLPSASVLFKNMVGSRMPVVVAHGEGQASFIRNDSQQQVMTRQQVSLRYVDNDGKMTETYPANPNGSPLGITGLCSADGRVNIMMPHPERVFLKSQLSTTTGLHAEHSPWLMLFDNAKKFFMEN